MTFYGSSGGLGSVRGHDVLGQFGGIDLGRRIYGLIKSSGLYLEFGGTTTTTTTTMCMSF